MKIVRRTSMLLASLVATGILTNVVNAQQDKPPDAAPKQNPEVRQRDSYYLATCPISGEELGGMGEPVIKIYDGREVRFCCKGCVSKFEKDKTANLAKLDEKMTKDQLPRYPLSTSLISGKDLPKKPVDFIHNNRLIRLIDAQEKERFLKEPVRYLVELDKAVIAKQSKDYSLKTCVVSGKNFGGEMGPAKDVVVAGRLIRICCNGCKNALEKTPAEFLAKVDSANQGSKKERGNHNDEDGDRHGKPGH